MSCVAVLQVPCGVKSELLGASVRVGVTEKVQDTLTEVTTLMEVGWVVARWWPRLP